MIGVMGYPVMMIAMNGDWQELLVQHWNRKVKIGDLMRVGEKETTARTYLVVKNQPAPKPNPHGRTDGWWAALVLAIMPITVAGETY